MIVSKYKVTDSNRVLTANNITAVNWNLLNWLRLTENSVFCRSFLFDTGVITYEFSLSQNCIGTCVYRLTYTILQFHCIICVFQQHHLFEHFFFHIIIIFRREIYHSRVLIDFPLLIIMMALTCKLFSFVSFVTCCVAGDRFLFV